MACLMALIAFGTGIVGKIGEYSVEPVARQVGYLFHFKSNFQNLESQVRDLGAAREGVQHKVVEEENRGRRVETSVNNWLTDVDNITGEANQILEVARQGKMKCLHGCCPNLKLRYQLSRKSTKLVRVVVELYGKKDFTNFAYDVPQPEVCILSTKDYEAFNSRTSTVNKIMDELRNPNTDTIGVYGIGGVGKTTLAEEVLRQADKDKNLFEEVVMVRDVKNNSNRDRVQKEIAEKLGMDFTENETLAGRARRLCNRINDKKILVILDDVWDEIDLKAVGLPHVATCKILLTSRSRIVLSSTMRKQKDFPLHILDQEETWSLFEKMAGDVVKDPAIRKVATQVAQRCGGLPILIATVASALKNKITLEAWRDALRRLKRFDKEEDLTKKAYLALEWSYNQLDDKELKPLFLLCGNSVVRNNVNLKYLWQYGMGLGLFKNVSTVEEARDALHLLVEKLKDSCLLLDGEDDRHVRMHDLVRDVANRIASVLTVDYGGDLKEWPDKDFSKKCTAISLNCPNIPRLPEVLDCQELELFYLQPRQDDLLEIPCNFFEKTKKLKVLDLTCLRILSLPSSFQFLNNIQTLCLDHCELGNIKLVGQLTNLQILSFLHSKVKQLPKEIGQLTHLRVLDLSNCSQLEVISPNVISSLTRLEDLRMRNSFDKWEGESEERRNASLLELQYLSQLTALEINIPDPHILPTNMFSTKLKRYQIYIGDAWKKEHMTDTNLNTIKLKLTTGNELNQGLQILLKECEDLYLDGTEEGVNSIVCQMDEEFQQLKHLHLQTDVDFTHIINRKIVLPNLVTLSVHGCGDLRFFLSSSVVRSLVQLKHLEISACELMEEIVSTKEYGEDNVDNMFCKLEDLRLKDLPNLTTFCTGSCIEFLLLEKLELVNCTKLREFIFSPISKNTTICKKIEEIDTKENLDVETEVQYFLFDKKVMFPSLERLVIDGLSKLVTIWHTQLAPYSFRKLRAVEVSSCDSLISITGLNALGADQLEISNYQTLESVAIKKCPRLKNIFPGSMTRCLGQLQKLEVLDCDEVEEIVAKDEGLETTPKFVFPKVTFVEFGSLPQLRSFYPGMHACKWPLLKRLEIYGCDKVKTFATKFSIFHQEHELNRLYTSAEQYFFLIEKDSFPNLEYLLLGSAMKIWYDPHIPEFFSKLKWFQCYAPLSKQAIGFFQKLHNLEKLVLCCFSSKEIFDDDGNSRGEIHAVGTLPHVRRLHLFHMFQLIHLGNENAQAAGPVFPNLEILQVEKCTRLEILEASAVISFQNLTTLEVIGCDKMEYLTTYLVAKSLMKLTKMKVLCCKRMIKIVASNKEDDAGNEIVFSRLQHLTLHSLPSLQEFCSENCIVKFPSLETLSVTSCHKLKTSPELERVQKSVGEEEDASFLDEYGNDDDEKEADDQNANSDDEKAT